MNASFHPDTPVGQIVAAQPLLARVFTKHSIDFCCGGKLSLASVCAKKGVAVETVIAELEALAQVAETPAVDWREAPIPTLVRHILDTHHAYLRQEMPRLTQLAAKVARVHGDLHPELEQIAQIFHRFYTEMDAHMDKEEQVLFPAILQLASGEGRFPVQHPIRMMEAEHDQSGEDLQTIRELSAHYQLPDGACNSYRALFAGLEALESDTFAHIHLENNVLFPRAIALVEQVTA